MNLTREQAFISTVSLMVLATVAASFALYWTRALAIPFVLAVLVTYLVGPIVDFAQVRLRAPRWAAILVAFLVVGAGGMLMAILLYGSAQSLADNADLYRARLTAIAEWGLEAARQIPDPLRPEGIDLAKIDASEVLDKVDFKPILGNLGTAAGDMLGLLSSLMTNGSLVLLFTFYLLLGAQPGAGDPGGVRGEIDVQIRSYLVWKFIMSAATGVLTWLLLELLGLDLALVFGVLAFLLNFIPSIGSLVAMVLPLPIAMIQFDSWWLILLVLVLPGTVQFVIGNLIEPMLMGDSLDLHPITVLLTLIFWGLLWGAVGMVLAVPLTSVLKIALVRFETTRPLAELLAGRLHGLVEMFELVA